MNIKLPELHYHSITCHVPCITVPGTALAYAAFLLTGKPFFHIAHIGLAAVSFLSFFIVFISGYLEREKNYVNWTPLFIGKLVFSGLHLFALIYQIGVMVFFGLKGEPLGLAYAVVTIGLQTLFIGILTYLGLVTAQGKVGGLTSYRQDKEYKLSYDIVKTVKESQPDPLKEVPYDRL
jgi:hypothetical protein